MPKNALDGMKAELKRYEQEFEKTIIDLSKLEHKRDLLEGQIKTARDFILMMGKDSGAENTELAHGIQLDLEKEFATLDPKPAYIEIAKKYLKGQLFKEEQLRNLAIEKGVRTKNGENISHVYSRNIISLHVKNGTFEKVKAGLYRLSDKVI